MTEGVKKNKRKGKKDEFDIGGRLIFGASSLAGLYHSIGENQAREVVKTAIEQGIRKFDTAPHYGCGLSERRLGEGIRQFVKKGQYLVDELDKRVDLDDIGGYCELWTTVIIIFIVFAMTFIYPYFSST